MRLKFGLALASALERKLSIEKCGVVFFFGGFLIRFGSLIARSRKKSIRRRFGRCSFPHEPCFATLRASLVTQQEREVTMIITLILRVFFLSYHHIFRSALLVPRAASVSTEHTSQTSLFVAISYTSYTCIQASLTLVSTEKASWR